MSTKINAPDLTQRPPRSPRVRLGGYVLLPRMLDKGRATVAGKNGEYNYNCPIDQHIINFLGIDPDALRAELEKDKGDNEILEWVRANARNKHQPWEIEQWSNYHDRRTPDGDVETLEFFTQMVGRYAKNREDIHSYFDLLDLDDYVTFGGRP